MKSLSHEIILASAGSGKTYQLTNRFIALLASGVLPESIVALTFTRKAAGEFLDAILEKLATAALDPKKASELGDGIGFPELDSVNFTKLLRSVLRSTHRLSLTTLDSFFIKIARTMPLELGLGGEVQMLGAGSRVEWARHDVFDAVFQMLQEDPEKFHTFLFALSETSYGQEDLRILPLIDRFVGDHHETILRAPNAEYWGNPKTIWPHGSVYADQTISDFRAAIDRLEKAFSTVKFTPAAQVKVDAFFPQARVWVFGDDVVAPMSSIMKNMVAAAPELARGNAIISIGGKKVEFDGLLAEIGLSIVGAYVGLEIGAKVKRTRALYYVLANYELNHDAMLRRRGKLAFDDLPVVLDRALRETAGIASELAYRLDGKYDHWLLDEFQDTSRRQWDVLHPLVDEVINDASGDRTYFQVGDTKQSIYAWRGGDPSLISDIREEYGRQLSERKLFQSYRSAPAVLDMVNTVFGNTEALAEIFPESSIAQLEWETHEPSSKTAGQRGYACLRHPKDSKDAPQEAVFDLALETVREVQPLERGLTCAIICAKNDTVTAITDHFRAAGITDIINGSRIKPATDNPVTLSILALLRFAAFPGDGFAKATVEMSPLADLVVSHHKTLEAGALAVLREVGEDGFAATVETLAEMVLGGGDSVVFTHHRLRQLIEIARTYDDEPDRSVAGFLTFAESFESAEVPSAGVIQVMTLHASKGLGFDMVILPELAGGRSLLELRGGLAIGGRQGAPEWVLDMPKQAAAQADSVLAEKFDTQKAEAGFESLCKLYVSMTRAKRGLYLLSNERKGNAANSLKVITETLEKNTEFGHPDWFLEFERNPVEPHSGEEEPSKSIQLGPVSQLRSRVGSRKLTSASPADRAHGIAVHAKLEAIEWQEAGEALSEAFVRPDGEVDLWREKAFECRIDGEWISGIFDRVVIQRSSKRVVVYEFKTGDTSGADIQLSLYEKVLAKMFPGYEIESKIEKINL